MYLLIVEVSQKQKYIFSSPKLKDNVEKSANIAQVVSAEYLDEIAEAIKRGAPDRGFAFNTADNMVYSGGGHTVLQFDTKEDAVDFARILTLKARRDFGGMELFAKVMEYDEAKTPKENTEELSKQLEVKKSLRKSAFRGESFTPAPNKNDFVLKCLPDAADKSNEYAAAKEYKGLKITNDIGKLAGGEDNSFVAVVHIDGNSMGKRVSEVREKASDKWDKFRTEVRDFSNDIDKAFKETFNEMLDVVVDAINENRIENIGANGYLPVRKLILAGDDVCFVCSGKIGLECANIFLERLSKKKNKIDNQNYYAAAGVCIVHTKFPFSRAYKIAEELCSNAKKMLAQNKIFDRNAMDWHIEFGEMESNIDAIKQSFMADDGTDMRLRPYLTGGTNIDNIVCYDAFKEIVEKLFKNSDTKMKISRGKLKELREAIREGKSSAEYFIKINRMQDILVEPISNIFGGIKKEARRLDELKQPNGIYSDDSRCIVYDAIECADLFETLEEV